MSLAVHHPQQHGRACRLGDGPPGCRKIVVGRGHSAILGQAQFTRAWSVPVQQCVDERVTPPEQP